jgi:hypothetical protein
MKGTVFREGIICDYNCKQEAYDICPICNRDICDFHKIGIEVPYSDGFGSRIIYVCYTHVSPEVLVMKNKNRSVKNPTQGAY